jgi:Fe-S oxidoreductase
VSIVKVLERLGCEVGYPEGQTCYGQPAFNSGYWDEARAVAEHSLDVFANSDVIVSASGSCGAMMKVFYPELFKATPRHFDALKLAPKIYEFSDFLVTKLGVTDVGGHSYGTTYQGPIGSVITPHLRGLQNWKHLSSASSLCGACTETCPVGIDLHHHLLHNRRNAMNEKPLWWEKIAYAGFVFLMRRPALYRIAAKLGAIFFPLHKIVNGIPLDPLQNWT